MSFCCCFVVTLYAVIVNLLTFLEQSSWMHHLYKLQKYLISTTNIRAGSGKNFVGLHRFLQYFFQYALQRMLSEDLCIYFYIPCNKIAN